MWGRVRLQIRGHCSKRSSPCCDFLFFPGQDSIIVQVHVAMQDPEGVLENEVEKKLSSEDLSVREVEDSEPWNSFSHR